MQKFPKGVWFDMLGDNLGGGDTSKVMVVAVAESPLCCTAGWHLWGSGACFPLFFLSSFTVWSPLLVWLPDRFLGEPRALWGAWTGQACHLQRLCRDLDLRSGHAAKRRCGHPSWLHLQLYTVSGLHLVHSLRRTSAISRGVCQAYDCRSDLSLRPVFPDAVWLSTGLYCC